jgi:hypothetical protein
MSGPDPSIDFTLLSESSNSATFGLKFLVLGKMISAEISVNSGPHNRLMSFQVPEEVLTAMAVNTGSVDSPVYPVVPFKINSPSLVNGKSYLAQILGISGNGIEDSKIFYKILDSSFKPASVPTKPTLKYLNANGATSFDIDVMLDSDGGDDVSKVLFYITDIAGGKLTTIIRDWTPESNTVKHTFTTASGDIQDNTRVEIQAGFVNSMGLSPLSNSIIAHPSNLPNAPTVANSVIFNSNIQVNFVSASDSNFDNITGVSLVNVQVPGSLTPVGGFVAFPVAYYAWNGYTLTQVSNLPLNGGYPMTSLANLSLLISGLTTNVQYAFELAQVNTYGIGDYSSPFNAYYSQPPGLVTNVSYNRITSSSTYPSISGYGSIYNSRYNSQVSAFLNQDSVSAFDITFKDPVTNWPNLSQLPSGAKELYKINVASVDATNSGLEVGVKAFKGLSTGSDVRTNAEKLLTTNNIIDLIQVTVLKPTLALWPNVGVSKLSLCNNSPALVAAVECYFACILLAKKSMDFINSASDSAVTINDNQDGSQTWSMVNNGYYGTELMMTSATPAIFFWPNGAIINFSIVASISSGGSDSLSSIVPLTIITCSLPSAELSRVSFKAAPSNILLDISEPTFFDGIINNNLNITISGPNIIQNLVIPMIVDKLGYSKDNNEYSLRDYGANFQTGILYSVDCSSRKIDTLTLLSNGTNQVITGHKSNISVMPYGIANLPVVDMKTVQGTSTTTGQVNINIQSVSLEDLNGATFVSYEHYLFDNALYPKITFTNEPMSYSVFSANGYKQTAVTANNYFSTYGSPSANNYTLSAYDYTLFASNLIVGHQYYSVYFTITNLPETNSAMGVSDLFVPFSAPLPPTSLALSNLNGKLSASWSPPTNDGLGSSTGANIANYKAELRQTDSAVILKTFITSLNSITISPDSLDQYNYLLTLGSSYNVTVSAIANSGIQSVSTVSNSSKAAKPFVLDSVTFGTVSGTSVVATYNYTANGSVLSNLLIAGTTNIGSFFQQFSAALLTTSPSTVTITGLPANSGTVVGALSVGSDDQHSMSYCITGTSVHGTN